MKWLGFSLIVLASSAWGVQMGEGYALRRKALEDVFSVLTGLQGEISSTHAPLPEIFRRLALREGEPWQSFLLSVENRLESCENGMLAHVWSEQVEKLPQTCGLNREDRAELSGLGRELGYPDLGMQLAALKNFSRSWERRIGKVSEEVEPHR